MEKNWSTAWKKALIWFSSYFSFIAFALVGGYTILKNDDEELKRTAKNAFIVCLIFACFSGFLTIFTNLAGMSDSYYSSAAYDFYDICSKLVNVARVVVYAVFIIVELVRKESPKPETLASPDQAE